MTKYFRPKTVGYYQKEAPTSRKMGWFFDMCGLVFFAAVALSVIDTSSSNFFAENWTQFPYSEFVAQTGVAGSGEEVLLESSDNNNQKKVNNAAVTVNSNKELQNPATSAISSSKDTKIKVNQYASS